jgi:hypothetical protein
MDEKDFEQEIEKSINTYENELDITDHEEDQWTWGYIEGQKTGYFDGIVTGVNIVLNRLRENGKQRE